MADPRMKAEHGDAKMYERHGCRCEVCVAGHRLKMKQYRERKKERLGVQMMDGLDVDEAKERNPYDPRLPSPHGTPQKYRRGGCRCDVCRAANSEAQAATRARKKAKAVRGG